MTATQNPAQQCDCGANPENRWPHHDQCALNRPIPNPAQDVSDARITEIVDALRRGYSVSLADADYIARELQQARAPIAEGGGAVDTLRQIRRAIGNGDTAHLAMDASATVGLGQFIDAAIESLSRQGGDDTARLDYIERTFGGCSNQERYLPLRMIWGKGCNGRTLREACDKYMARDAIAAVPAPGGE